MLILLPGLHVLSVRACGSFAHPVGAQRMASGKQLCCPSVRAPEIVAVLLLFTNVPAASIAPGFVSRPAAALGRPGCYRRTIIVSVTVCTHGQACVAAERCATAYKPSADTWQSGNVCCQHGGK